MMNPFRRQAYWRGRVGRARELPAPSAGPIGCSITPERVQEIRKRQAALLLEDPARERLSKNDNSDVR